METMRSETWKAIWQTKYAKTEKQPLHVLDGFNDLSTTHWQHLVSQFTANLELPPGSRVVDVGCGAGAFLECLQHCQLAGVDYSAEAIARIRTHLSGDFRVAEASQLPFPDDAFDAAISFGIFYYFDSLDYARQVLDEMSRVLKPGGMLFVGDINDKKKEQLYYKMRQSENRDSNKLRKTIDTTHLFIPKYFFQIYASLKNLDIKVIDEDQMNIDYYSSSSYRYSVLMKDKY